jgi:zinc transport system ATP-binding protein
VTQARPAAASPAMRLSNTTTPDPTPAVELRDVTFSYWRHPVLSHVDLTIARGEFATVVGPNGGGKTTLLKLMLGLLSPDSGTVRVLGTTPAAARSRVGCVPQRASVDASFPARVIDIVLMGLLGSRRGMRFSQEDLERARTALESVELADFAGHRIAELSGGQRQRALIARALVSGPELLLLDEPAAHLDVVMERGLHDLLGRLRESATIVLVSHDLGFVSDYADRAVCVKNTVAVHETCELTSDVVRELYGREVRMVRHDD